MPNKLQVELQLLDKLTSPLNRAAADINGITKRIEGAFKFVTAAGAVTGLAVGIGAVVNKSIEFGDHIDDLSKKLNMSAESVQLWDVVLKNNNSSLDAAAGGFQNLNAMAYSAAIGQKKSAILFKQLNVEVTDANGSLRSQNEILNDTIYKLADLKDATLQSALAQKLGLTEMLPTIRQGSKAIKEQIEQAKEYGIVSGTTVEKLAQAKDNMDHFQRSTAALSAEFTATFIPALSSATEWLTDFTASWNYLLYHDKEDDKVKKLRAIGEEIKAFAQLKKEQEDIVQVGEASKYQLYSKDSVEQAKANIETIIESIRQLNKESNDVAAGRGTNTNTGATLIDPNADKDIEAAAKKRLETWVRVSKEINDLTRDYNYEETKKLWEASHPQLTNPKSTDIEIPEYLKEDSPLTKLLLNYKDLHVRTNDEIAQSYIDTGMRISSAIGTMVSLQNSMTENRIAKMKAEGTLTKENEQDFREHMRRRQGVLAAIAIAEAAAAAVSSVYKAWKDGGSWYEALAKSIAGGLEVAAVTATQVSSIKAASFAGGVRNYVGGWADVGEQGKERVWLPPGSSVYTAHETSRMQNQSSPTLHVTFYDTQGVVTREVERSIRSGEFDTALRMMERKMSRS